MAAIDMGRKDGRLLCPFRRGAGSPSNTMWPGLRSNFRTKWHVHPSSRLATIDMGWKLGAVPLLGGAEFLSNTTSPGPRPTSIPSGILIHPAVWPQRIWAENGGLCPFRGGGAGSPNSVAWAEAYLYTKWHPDASSRLAIIEMGQKLGGGCAAFLGELGPSI